MDGKKIFLILIITTLLVGCAFAAKNTGDFKINENEFKDIHTEEYYSLHLNDKNNTGIVIYKNVDDDKYDDATDPYKKIIHDEGKDYMKSDDDVIITKNPDNTANFTDKDKTTHGVVELVESEGQQFVVVFFTTNDSGVNEQELTSKIADFNKNNDLKILAF